MRVLRMVSDVGDVYDEMLFARWHMCNPANYIDLGTGQCFHAGTIC